MIYTKPEEIEIVKQNLVVFEAKIPSKIVDLLLNPQERFSQHGLFYSLCNPAIFPYLVNALQNIKDYNQTLFSKAVKKLVRDPDWLNHQANVAEVIVVGYYCNKFKDDTNISVVWERKVGSTNKNVDLPLLGYRIPINIEITGLHQDSEIRKHFDLRTTIKVAIERAISIIPDPQFSYIFSIAEGSSFSEEDIQDFVKFILQKRDEGVGLYKYEQGGSQLASVKIQKLNKLKEEYTTDLDMWSGFLNDDKRLRNKVVDKAKDQLPSDEINYICVPNLSGFDTIDIEEALLGKEQWHISGDKVIGLSRKPDGALYIIKENGFSPVHGLIHFKWNYQDKKIVYSPFDSVDVEVKSIVS